MTISALPQHPGGQATRLGAFYAASFLVVGIQLPFWPVWLAGRSLDAQEIALVFAAAIWAKVVATPLLGALADRLGRRRAVMIVLAACAWAAYAGLWPVAGFWSLLALNLVAGMAQSALMPLGDSITLAAVREEGLDYGRIRVWGSVSFILASVGSGALLAASSPAGPADNQILLLVLAAPAVLALCRQRCGAAIEPPALLRLRDPLLARARFFRHGHWRVVGRGGRRRDRAVLVQRAVRRPLRAARADGAGRRGRHPALEPDGHLAGARRGGGAAAAARLDLWREPSGRDAFPRAQRAVGRRGERAIALCRLVGRARQRSRHAGRGRALYRLWRPGLPVDGAPVRRRPCWGLAAAPHRAIVARRHRWRRQTMLQNYEGGCHCGRVRFRIQVDL